MSGSGLTTDLDLLADLTPEELVRVDSIAETRRYEPGDVILRQGVPADAIFVLLEGSVRVTAILSEGDEAAAREEEVLTQLKPGEVFGELSFITGAAPTLSVVAEESATLAAFPQAALHALINTDASICRKLLFAITRMLVSRLTSTGRELVLTRYFLRGQ